MGRGKAESLLYGSGDLPRSVRPDLLGSLDRSPNRSLLRRLEQAEDEVILEALIEVHDKANESGYELLDQLYRELARRRLVRTQQLFGVVDLYGEERAPDPGQEEELMLVSFEATLRDEVAAAIEADQIDTGGSEIPWQIFESGLLGPVAAKVLTLMSDTGLADLEQKIGSFALMLEENWRDLPDQRTPGQERLMRAVFDSLWLELSGARLGLADQSQGIIEATLRKTTWGREKESFEDLVLEGRILAAELAASEQHADAGKER